MVKLPKRIRDILDLLVSDLKSRESISGVGLFGSWSRGDAVLSSDIDLLVVGEPISYEVKDVEKDKLILSSVSGSLRCLQLTGGSLMLSNDQLELINFAGDIEQVNNSITVTGQVDKMRLNGVEISK